MDDKTLLWHLYQDNRAQAQFHELQRNNGSALIGGGAAVIVAAIAQDGDYARPEVPLACILTLLGVFGFLFCLKSSERMQLHINRCRKFLPMLDDLDTAFDLMEIKNECDRKTGQEFPFATKVKLRTFWQGMHVLIVLTGLGMLALIYFG